MSGEIKGISGSPLSPAKVREGDRPARGARAAERGGDRLTLTDTAAALGNLDRTLAQIPVVNGAKVDGIREALAEGTYEVSPHRIAEKLIRFELMYNRAQASA